MSLATRAASKRPHCPADFHGRPACVVLLFALALDLAPRGAIAQLNLLSPTFENLNGAAVWGSAGLRAVPSAGGVDDKRAIWTGGFAVFYGPFGGHGDTLVTFTQSVTDSSDTTFCDCTQAPSHEVHRHTRSTRALRVDSKRLGGGGKATLVVGYQHSAFYRFGADALPDAIPLGGVYVASLLGPYDLPFGTKRMHWHVGMGGTIVRLSEIAARTDTTALVLSTERTFAPQALVMLTYAVAPGYRAFVSASYQYLRFGSVAFRAAQPGQDVPAAVLATLPEKLELQSVHLSLGFSFTASGLIPGR